jgi:hypothetical protein
MRIIRIDGADWESARNICINGNKEADNIMKTYYSVVGDGLELLGVL